MLRVWKVSSPGVDIKRIMYGKNNNADYYVGFECNGIEMIRVI